MKLQEVTKKLRNKVLWCKIFDDDIVLVWEPERSKK